MQRSRHFQRNRIVKTLVIFVHPAFERSLANRALVKGISDLDGVTFHDLYEAYPDFDIDVAREQRLLEEHDRIVWQHPFYWYSSPSLLKEWLDVVLKYGWAYGPDGKALIGKTVKSVITTGAGQDAYSCDGRHCFAMKDFLLPFQQTARLCGMTYEDPLVFYKTLASSEGDLVAAASTYHNWLREG